MIINSDLNGNLNSDFDVRKINVWNYIGYTYTILDHSTFQDNTNDTSVRLYWHIRNGSYYTNADKNFIAYIDNANIRMASFRPIIECRE